LLESAQAIRSTGGRTVSLRCWLKEPPVPLGISTVPSSVLIGPLISRRSSDASKAQMGTTLIYAVTALTTRHRYSDLTVGKKVSRRVWSDAMHVLIYSYTSSFQYRTIEHYIPSINIKVCDVFCLYLCKCDKNGEISVSVGHASSIPQHQLRVRVIHILFLSKTSHKGPPIISHVSRCPKPYARDTLKKGKSGACFQPFTSTFLTPSHNNFRSQLPC
jgi:hypothetical protein